MSTAWNAALGGRPAMGAYAMHCVINNAPTVRPPTTSPRSHPRS